MPRFFKDLLGLLFCILFFLPAKAQDSCHLQVSLLTCSPGEELYSTFGHSAFRVTDRTTGIDVIFNYGTFDFYDPAFYTKFVRGKLLYFVSAQDFPGFREDYRMEGRGIVEQKLDLPCGEKEKLFQALQINLKEENKYYKYDFLYDNCSTRLKDMLKQTAGPAVSFRNILPSEVPSFRNLIHTYLERGNKYWSKLGIDLLLGSPVDKKVTNEQSMFLPDYLYMGFDSAYYNNERIVKSKQVILEPAIQAEGSSWFRPIVFTSILLILVGILQFSRKKWAFKFLCIFDPIFFILLGALGCLMVFMWVGTEHTVCANNYNLLWALPTHLPVALVLYRKKEWIRKYFILMSAWYFILFFAWALLPQEMNSAVVPLVIIAFMRSIVRYRKNRGDEKTNSASAI